MNKHTAESLGKYLGKKVWVEKFAWGVRKKSQVIILDSLATGESDSGPGCNIGVLDEDTTFDFYPERVYPILKAVEDLPEEEFRFVYGHSEREGFYNSFINDGSPLSDFGYARLLEWDDTKTSLFSVNAGAIKHSRSPTGYVSLFDELPCKRWSDVFK